MALKELLNKYNVAKDKAYWIQEALVEVNVLEETVTFAFEGTDKERKSVLDFVPCERPEACVIIGVCGKDDGHKSCSSTPRVRDYYSL